MSSTPDIHYFVCVCGVFFFSSSSFFFFFFFFLGGVGGGVISFCFLFLFFNIQYFLMLHALLIFSLKLTINFIIWHLSVRNKTHTFVQI